MGLTVLLIRHGALVGDAASRFIGRTDLPMAEAGAERIRRLAAALACRPMEAIYCSELGRSRRTSDILAAGRSVPVHVAPALDEIHMGSWEGRLRREVATTDPAAYEARGRDIVHARPPGGESFADLAGRVLPLWRSIISAHDGTVAIAGHAGINRVILCDVLGLPLANLFRLAQAPGCVNVVAFGHNGPVVRLLAAAEIPGPKDSAHAGKDLFGP